MQRRRKALIIVSCVAAIIVLTAAFSIMLISDLSSAKKSLFQGRDNLRAAYVASNKAEFLAAKRYFKQAKSSFMSANNMLNKPDVKILSVLPLFDNNLTALQRLSSAGIEITVAGESLVSASMKFPQTSGRLEPSFKNGKIDVEPFINAKPDIDKANLHVLLAVAEHNNISHGFLFSPIKKASGDLGEQLSKLQSMTTNAKQAFNILPGVLGANGKRRYFLAVQNNAELRATGGIIGNYGIITLNNGRMVLEEFDEIHKLQKIDQRPVYAPRDFNARYARYKGTSMWLNANMSPDFPTVSRVLIELYKSVTGERLDGVISIDPMGLKYLLNAIGPVRLADESINIDDRNVIDWTLVEAYKKYTKREERKDFLASVAKAVWEQIATGRIADKSKLIDQFNLALAEKHMALYSTYGEEQQLMEKLGYAGKLVPASSDYLQVLMQNHGGNKVDLYVHERIGYSITLRPDGSALAKTSVKVSNKTPMIGLPAYVTGEHPYGVKDGYSNTWLNIYTPKDAQLLLVKEGNEDKDVDVGCEKDKAIFSQYLQLAPGESRTVDFVYELPDVLVFDKHQILYAIDWQAQPVINKPTIDISITPPKGFKFSQIPTGFKRKGNKLVLNGILVRDRRFDFSLVDNR